MNITITNKTADINGKTIAYASLDLHIRGERYPVRLMVHKDDKAKLNRALRKMDYVIGETSDSVEPKELAFCITTIKEKGE